MHTVISTEFINGIDEAARVIGHSAHDTRTEAETAFDAEYVYLGSGDWVVTMTGDHIVATSPSGKTSRWVTITEG